MREEEKMSTSLSWDWSNRWRLWGRSASRRGRLRR